MYTWVGLLGMTESLTCLIIFTTFERPRMARAAIESVRDQTSPNWKLVVIDDNFPESPPFEPIAREILKDHLDKVTFYKINDSLEKRRNQGGTAHGNYMNKGIIENNLPSNSLVINLCEDDFLFPHYVEKLNNFYMANPEARWSYCHLSPWDPFKEKWKDVSVDRDFGYNYTEPLYPFNRIDGSQVSFRKSCFSELGASYPTTGHRCFDAYIFDKLQPLLGTCPPNLIKGQGKGWLYGTDADGTMQLGQRNRGNEYLPLDLP